MRAQVAIPVIVSGMRKWILVKAARSSKQPAADAVEKVKELGFRIDEERSFVIIDVVIDMD